MTFLTNSLADLNRTLRTALAAVLLAIPASPALAAEAPTTHHFSIVRPASPIIVGTPVDIEVTARLENNKINKKADNTVLIQMTSGRGAAPQTLTQEAKLDRGLARVTVSFQDVGPVILQVTDKENAMLSNSASISVLPQPRQKGVRP